MLTVDEALARILAETRPLAPREIALAEALGCVLAADVASDVDSPPFDKALMDGYAVVASDLQNGEATLEVIEEIAAGATPTKTISTGKAARIMTGAPIPAGADAVVMIERSTLLPDGRVQLKDLPVKPGQNLLPRAAAMRKGEVVLPARRLLRAMEIGLLAEVGVARPQVHPHPRAAILATGNELVSVDQTPGPGQIRNSNSSMLVAQCQRAGAQAIALGIAQDNEASLREMISRGLENADLLLLSGGVSAGKFDLAPQVLESLGAQNYVRRVALKPGKPLWFGTLDRDQRRTLIFGLPGNPASSLVCFELFVAPAIARLAGHPPAPRTRQKAELATAWTHRGDRPTFFPGRWEKADAAVPRVHPLPWKGSADLRTIALADCLLCFPPGETSYPAGAAIDVIPLN